MPNYLRFAFPTHDLPLGCRTLAVFPEDAMLYSFRSAGLLNWLESYKYKAENQSRQMTLPGRREHQYPFERVIWYETEASVDFYNIVL